MSINAGSYMTEGMNIPGARGAYEDRRTAVEARMAFVGESEAAAEVWRQVDDGGLTNGEALRIIIGKDLHRER